MNAEIGSNAVAGTVQIIHTGFIERLSGYYVDAGIIYILGENEHGKINGPHKNPCVELFLPLCCSSEVEGSRHVCGAICDHNIATIISGWTPSPVVFRSYSTSDAHENIWLIIYSYKFMLIR